jgi:chemotaxis protein methyltransferase CheR
MAIPDDKHIHEIVDLIHIQTGLSVGENKIQDITVAAQALMASQQITDMRKFAQLCSTLPITHPILQELIHIVTIGETYFFRYLDQFNALRSEVLPALIKQRREARNYHLRLWCAGCATGEEPYSLAILLRDLIPDYQSWQITLLATDLNVQSLERAKLGVYRTWSFRNETPPEVQERWFRAEQGYYRLDASVKKMVTFAPLNLTADEYPAVNNGTSNLDVIMCRNVTIYFEQETTRQIASRFFSALNDNGWLVVGHSEPNLTTYQGFIPRNFTNTVLYQKALPVLPDSYNLPSIEPVQDSATTFCYLTTEPKRRWSDTVPPTVPREQAVVLPRLQRPSAWHQAKQCADMEKWQEALTLLALAEASITCALSSRSS